MTGQEGWLRDARERLAHPGARKWYWGSVWGLLYLAFPITFVWATATTAIAVIATLLVVVIGALYVVLPPMLWRQPWQVAATALTGFVALTCLAIPFVGLNTIWFWLYVPIMASFSWQSRRFALATIAIVVLAQLAVIGIAGQFVEYWYAVALTASLGIMMFAFGRQIQGIIKLQAAQQEVARLAVVEERARFSRDLHDVLGHSLTVVTVKSELARRLVSLDPTRAEAEIADIERLARAALADLRAAVAGYREIALSTELAAAHVALTAADIEAHLPPNSDSAAADSAAAEPAAAEPAADLRELFGWVLREAVTNVVRHSGARNCWVHVTRTELTVDDDGHGITDAPPRTSATGSLRRAGGVGLLGLRERAEKAGAELTVTTNERGGVQVAVRRAA